ncbi:site-specific DNA-methyltransferase, partial [Bacteroides sp. AF15-14LB]
RRLRYAWVWEKTQATGFLNAGRMPMKAHEDILVFYDRLPKYHPIKTDGHRRKVVMAEHQRKCDAGEIYRKHDNFRDYISTERYPRSVLKFKTDKQRSCLHATQKPVALLEYLIRTYTDEGDIVLDFAMGSGSTAVACRNTGRRFVGVEIDREIFQTALNRITHG